MRMKIFYIIIRGYVCGCFAKLCITTYIHYIYIHSGVLMFIAVNIRIYEGIGVSYI